MPSSGDSEAAAECEYAYGYEGVGDLDASGVYSGVAAVVCVGDEGNSGKSGVRSAECCVSSACELSECCYAGEAAVYSSYAVYVGEYCDDVW